MNSNKVHVLKLSDIRGWSMLCEDASKLQLNYFYVDKSGHSGKLLHERLSIFNSHRFLA